MYKRIIVKIGTGVLLDNKGELDILVLQRLVEEAAQLKSSGVEVVIVTSGAVGFGRGKMRSANTSEAVISTKVMAAVGQVQLMSTYDRLLSAHSIVCAQVLVTKEDFRDREHYQNMRETFVGLLRDNIMPIVNENDVIAHREISFTDNDELAGLIAAQLEADAVIILSSVAGVLSGGEEDSTSQVIPSIGLAHIEQYQALVSKKKTSSGRGGMQTKFAIAHRLMLCGIAVHIAHGKQVGVLESIMQGDKVGTHFVPEEKVSGIKRRLAYADGFSMGTIVVNKRAGEMLSAKTKAMSILPVGIVRVEEDFGKGDIVEIVDESARKIGFGIAASDAKTTDASIGKQGARPAVHYNYLLII